MTNQEIQSSLISQYSQFEAYINSLSQQEFLFTDGTKWSAGQQLEHMVKATSPLKPLSALPKFILGWRFGKANRPSKSYDELVAKYQAKLAAGGKASAPFIPKEVSFEQKIKLNSSLEHNIKVINKGLSRFSESELDTYIIPHPLLGKLTLREMAYFTIYHCAHHENAIKHLLFISHSLPSTLWKQR